MGSGSASTILTGGPIVPLAGPNAEALALTGDRILAIGTRSDVLALRGPHTEVVDLGGRLVLPAFTDAHTHFAGFAVSRSRVDLKDVASLDEAGQRVAAAARQCAPGAWITGRGWAHDLWGGTLPTAALLDRVAPGYPVALSRNDGHGLWVSSEALRRASITRDTPDPPGGAIMRDPAGEPTGVLTERAMDLIYDLIPPPSPDQVARAVVEALPIAHQAGLAGVTCMEGLDAYRVYRSLYERGVLGLRIGMCLEVATFDEEVALIAGEGRGDEWIHWTQLKMFADGALNPRTAWMLEPYADDPTNRGISVTPPAEIRRLVEAAANAGFGSSVHAIGDAANRAVLDVYEATRPLWQPRGLRPRIEHAQTLAPSDVPRFGELGVVASMQPIHCTQDLLVNDKALGPRARNAYPFRRLIDGGARLAFGSDVPVETLDVLQGLYAATARRRANGYPEGGWYPEERLTMREAVTAYTIGAAWAEGEESRRGTIEPGKLADLVILSRDIFQGPPEVLLDTRVEGTIVGGAWVHRTFS
jgi:predicted amidohydrolase YtcJ